MKLHELVEEYGVNTVIYADDGNGCAFGTNGSLVDYTQDFAGIDMHELDTQHLSDDEVICWYSSDWIITGSGDNPYKYKIFY